MSRTVSDPTVRLFWTFLAAHVAAWTLVPALAQPNAPFDTIEMLYWGHEWQWGYFKHPPLPAWIAEACWLMFGSVEWPLYLASQLCVAACLWAAWQMARETLPPWPALAAAAILETNFYFTFVTPEFNNNLPAKAGWALATLGAWRGLVRHDWRWWAAAGAALGLALLSKYDAALLVAALGGFLLVHPAGRSAWRTAGPWTMLAVMGLVVAPHLAWLVVHDAPTLAYAGSRAAPDGDWLDHVRNPLWFLGSQLVAVGGAVALTATVVRPGWQQAAQGDRRRLHRDYLGATVLGPPLLAAAAAALTGIELQTMWGAAMWTHAGVLLLVAFAAGHEELPFRRIVVWSAVAGAVMLAAFTVRMVGHAALTGRPSRVHFPGRELARAVEDRWQQVTDEPLGVIAGDWWAAGNAAFYHPERPDVFPELRADWAPWTDDETLRTSGGVIIWPLNADHADAEHADNGNADANDADDQVAAWLRRFPQAVPATPIELAPRTVPATRLVSYGVAIVPPASDSPSVKPGSGWR